MKNDEIWFHFPCFKHNTVIPRFSIFWNVFCKPSIINLKFFGRVILDFVNITLLILVIVQFNKNFKHIHKFLMNDLFSMIGTPYWMAPEVIEMTSMTSKCDIWSVGCLLIELLTGFPPFFDIPAYSALFRIVTDTQIDLPNGISSECADFLKMCLTRVGFLEIPERN